MIYLCVKLHKVNLMPYKVKNKKEEFLFLIRNKRATCYKLVLKLVLWYTVDSEKYGVLVALCITVL